MTLGSKLLKRFSNLVLLQNTSIDTFILRDIQLQPCLLGENKSLKRMMMKLIESKDHWCLAELLCKKLTQA